MLKAFSEPNHALGVFVLLIAAMAASSCSSEPDAIGIRGRTIEIHSERPVVTEKVSFTDGNGELRVIRPSASNRQLAAVLITVVNRTSTVMPLLIDPEAADLGDRRGKRMAAIDPFERSIEASSSDDDTDKFMPLLWGEIDLDREFQVQGWVFFDVPKGLTLGTLWWNEVDDVLLDYVEYTRR